MERETIVSIIGVMHSENEVEIQSVMRLEAVPLVDNGVKTGMMAELIGSKGKVIASAPVYRLRTHSMSHCGCDEDSGDEENFPYLFQTFIPNAGEGEGLRIRDGEKVVWHRPAPSEKGSLAGFRARVREDLLVVEWQFRAAGEVEPEFWLQWSNDEGKTWNALATSMHGEKAEVNISGLPSGDVAVRLLASDGFSTTVSEHVHIDVPSRGPVVSIMHPREGQTLMAGQPMRLLGMVSERDRRRGGG